MKRASSKTASFRTFIAHENLANQADMSYISSANYVENNGA